jgi:hypothetical protein
MYSLYTISFCPHFGRAAWSVHRFVLNVIFAPDIARSARVGRKPVKRCPLNASEAMSTRLEPFQPSHRREMLCSVRLNQGVIPCRNHAAEFESGGLKQRAKICFRPLATAQDQHHKIHKTSRVHRGINQAFNQ